MCSYTITSVRQPSDLQHIAELRSRVFLDELGRRFVSSSVQSGSFLEPLDAVSTNLVFKIDDLIVGGLRLTPLSQMVDYDLSFERKYGPSVASWQNSKSVYLSRLFLAREYRSREWFVLFMAKVYQYLKDSRISCAYINTCWKLLRTYRKLGFELAADAFYLDEVDDYVLPMVAVFDHDYLKRVKSDGFKSLVRNPQAIAS